MKNRFLKQFLYGLFYLSVFSLFGFLIFLYFKPSPSCSDLKKNSDETEVDCGGSCVPCEIKKSSGLKITSKKILSAGNSLSTFLIEISNPLNNFGASSLSYHLSAKNSSGQNIFDKTGASFIYAGESKYIIEPGIELSPDSVSEINIDLKNEEWASRDSFKIPKIQYRDLKIAVEGKFINVSGSVLNSETVPFPEVLVNVLFYDGVGNILGASKTIIEDIQSFGEKTFFVSHPVINADLSKTKVLIYAKRPGVFGFPFDSF
ncbi:MAG: hypothetical protein WC435_03215 [Candidatus Paceibacterota bacterium]